MSEITIQEPKGVKECARMTRALIGVLYVCNTFGAKDYKAFRSIFLTYEWSEQELDSICSFIIDKDELRFNIEEKKENIPLNRYLQGMDLFIKWIYNYPLPDDFYDEELTLPDFASVERTIDRLRAWREEESSDFGIFFINTMKKYSGK